MEGRREVPKYRKDGSLASKPAVQYCCQVCNQWVSSTKVSVDHKEPVIPLDGSFDPQNPDWNMFVERLWCDKSNLQRICDICHQAKTNQEREARKQLKEAIENAKIAKIIVE
jgi:5-methylcytosine-specific restriction endonuclease McrA